LARMSWTSAASGPAVIGTEEVSRGAKCEDLGSRNSRAEGECGLPLSGRRPGAPACGTSTSTICATTGRPWRSTRGFTGPIVMALGGWKTERMMRRYAAVTDQTLRAAAEAVSGNGRWQQAGKSASTMTER
jgi:hypothetical protein